MGPLHMTPEQAVKAQRTLNASVAIAMHFGTFALADESMAAPVERLQSRTGKLSSPKVCCAARGRKLAVCDLPLPFRMTPAHPHSSRRGRLEHSLIRIPCLNSPT